MLDQSYLGTPTFEERFQLARAVTRPGSWARLYAGDGSNRSGRSGMLRAAVKSGEPFFVPVASHILAADCDSEQTRERLAPVLEDMTACGLHPVLVASGQPGRFHVFVVPGDHRLAFEERLRSIGADIRSTIRPPLTPHRLGLPVRLVHPGSIPEAIAALRPRLEVPPGALPPWAWDLLRNGPHGTDRSSAIVRVAGAFQRAGLSFGHFVVQLRDERNELGQKYRNHPTPEKFAQAEWAAASKFRPHRAQELPLPPRIRDFALAIDLTPFPGRTGSTLRSLLYGLADIAWRKGRCESIPISQRSLAEASGLSRDAVQRHLPNAIQHGWLALHAPGRGALAPSYTLALPADAQRALAQHSFDASADHKVWHRGCVCGLETLTPSHDAFSHGALNRSGREVAMQLAPRQSGATVAELSARTGRSEQTVRNALQRLRAAGLADREEGSWPPRWVWLHDRDLREVARDLGVDGRSERRARRFDAERAEYSRVVQRSRSRRRGEAAGE